MLRKIICFFSVLLMLLTNNPGFAQAEQPQISARTAVLMDAHSGEILFGKKPYQRRAPASTTKIMTALLVLENGDLDQVIEITQQAAGTKVGSDMGLRKGDKIKLKELLKGALIISANDGAVAIAEAIAGSEARFAVQMTRKAMALGAYQTNFANANGYTKADHYSTAYDLALMGRAAMNNPLFASLVGTRETVIHWENRTQTLPVRNTNWLLWSYPATTGIKTGTTSAAGQCLVASAQKEGWELIAVVLGSQHRFTDAEALLNYGFENYYHLRIEPGQEYQVVPVENGMEATVALYPTKAVEFTCPQEKVVFLETKIIPYRSFRAPIKKEEKLAEVVVEYQGQVVARTDLIAAKEVKGRTWLHRIFNQIWSP